MRALTAAVGAILAAGLASSPATAGDLTISARAGLDGVTRPGRWAPILVALDNQSATLSGELVVEWGRTRIRRPVELPAPSSRSLVVFARTGDVRNIVSVRVESAGRILAATEVPVRIGSYDERVTLCVGDIRGVEHRACTVFVSPAALPASPRTFEGADEVILGANAPLSPEQAGAFAVWKAQRRLEAVGSATPSTGARPEPSPRSQHAATAVTTYGGLLAMTLAAFPHLRRRGLVFPAIFAVTIGGSAAAGAAGCGRAIVVHHASIVEQFASTSPALVTTRGVVEYPAAVDGVTVDACDAVVEPDTLSGGETEHVFDAAGCPRLPGDSALGRARAFTLSGSVPFRAFDFAASADGGRITNVSGQELHTCELPGAFGTTPRSLRPGESIAARRPWGTGDPVVSCRLEGSPVAFRHDTRDVVARGTTIAVLHLPPDDYR